MTPLARDEAITEADALIERAPQMDGEEWAVKALPVLMRVVGQARDNDRWLAWSGGEYPDDSPGDVIAAEADGTIVLDDGITTWNPLRALAFVMATKQDSRLADALRPFAEFPPITTAQRNRGYVTARIDPAWIDAARAALAGAGVTDNERTAAYCTCDHGADGNPCASCGKPEAITVYEPAGERTAEETSVRTWATKLWHERGYNTPGGRTAGTGPTAAEHAEKVKRALTCPRYGDSDWHAGTCVHCEQIEEAVESVAALVALADRSNLIGYECAHGHKWWMMEGEFPTRCAVCNTSTFAVLAGGAGDE